MKTYININSYDKSITTRALLVGAYGSLHLPEQYEAAAQRNDLSWAMERAVFCSKRAGGLSKGFKTAREANEVASTLRRSIDMGQGMMVGAGKLASRIYDDVAVVKG